VRVGYDDNVYGQVDGEDSVYVSDILNLSSTLNVSSRTKSMLYWQPEFKYRPDLEDDEFITSQNLYGKLDHELSQRLSLEITDHVRYQPKEGPSEVSGAKDDQQFIQNSLKAGVNYVLNPQSYLMFGAGHEIRFWDDDAYGKGDKNNNYDQVEVNGSFVRQLNADVTQGILGANYVDLQYEGDRGGYESVTVFAGVDHLFNPDLTGYARAGASFSTVESELDEADSTSPYFDAGLTLNPEGRTSIDIIGSLGFQAYRSENSLYNIQNRLNIGTSIRHDLTAKITLAAAVSYIKGFYESEFVTAQGASLADAEDNYVSFNVRCSYQINRNNFVELGYEYEDRFSSDFSEWDRNRVEAGWRVRL